MVLEDVLEEHLDEASFRWLQWERALEAPDFNLTDTAAREEQLAAHLHGLVLGGTEAAASLLWPALDSGDASRITAAAYVLLSQGQAEVLLNFMQGASSEVRAAVRRAVEVSASPGLGSHVLPLLKRDDLSLQAHVLEAMTFRHEAPPELLTGYFLHDEPRARMAALRASDALPEDTVRRLLPGLLESEHPGIRAAAMEAGLTAGARGAWEACRQAVRACNAHTPQAMVLLALFGNDADTALLVDMLGTRDMRPHALWALGFSGRLVAMEACLALLEDPLVARLAGEAFSAMTGLPLEGLHALPPGEQPEGAPPSPEQQEDLDADLVPRPEDELPWPCIGAVRYWWKEARPRFHAERRYLNGQLLEGPVLLEALTHGPMRRRHVLAREFAIRSQGRHRIPTRAFTQRQWSALAQARGACEQLRLLPLERTLR
ncbi:TIGR02270 family protein [Pyxidicoccus fallax]|uniref:TIGR02270 family protein n=1 Tax=Pyxidicoccus fallax TaxID=394095 RepID=A0A848LR51_9BACT|nr:TIGR02270 family protein [Pyxidicoccus fallax]NMO20033.1 TIGR02270 family protein [Pyxidicoccus fallax]NPC80663.1 TIGR02270 family protein [Pyxidicoccus fallax]